MSHNFTGFYVMSPSSDDLQQFMIALASGAAEIGGYAEQDFLNWVYADTWQRLPCAYNGQKGISHHHPELWNPQELAVIHYVDSKPWDRDDPR